MIKRTFYMTDFYGFVNASKDILVEAMWIFNGDGSLEYTEMDPINVACMHAKIKVLGIEDEKIDYQRIMVNMAHLRNLLKKLLKDQLLDHDSVRISVHEKKLMLEYQDLTVTTPVEMVTEDRKVVIPDFKGFTTKVSIRQSDFQYMIDVLSVSAESIRFNTKNKRLFLKAEGDVLESEYIASTASVEGADCSNKFSTEYLLRTNLPGEELSLNLGNDYLIKIEDELGNWFLIAPRVDNN